jgi:hypothetical protein
MKDLSKTYPCNGGAFFWAASDDVSGSWSETVGNEIKPHAGCSDASSPSPLPAPTETPINPTQPGGGTCGEGNVGNGMCADTTECCSEVRNENAVSMVVLNWHLRLKIL